jgi:hypothetical protein
MDPKKAQHLYTIKWTQAMNDVAKEMEELFESAIELRMHQEGMGEAKAELKRIMAL